jgi:hypothetical protein
MGAGLSVEANPVEGLTWLVFRNNEVGRRLVDATAGQGT